MLVTLERSSKQKFVWRPHEFMSRFLGSIVEPISGPYNNLLVRKISI